MHSQFALEGKQEIHRRPRPRLPLRHNFRQGLRRVLGPNEIALWVEWQECWTRTEVEHGGRGRLWGANAPFARNLWNTLCAGSEFSNFPAVMSPTKPAFTNTSKCPTLSTVRHVTRHWDWTQAVVGTFWILVRNSAAMVRLPISYQLADARLSR